MKITSYLMFNGQAEEAANFYVGALGGSIENLYRYNQMPPSEGESPYPAECAEWIMHCCVDFPGGSMSVADAPPFDPRSFGNGGHILTLSVDSAEQARAVWARLADGAQKIDCPLAEAFWAKLYGEVVDRFGVRWAVMYE